MHNFVSHIEVSWLLEVEHNETAKAVAHTRRAKQGMDKEVRVVGGVATCLV